MAKWVETKYDGWQYRTNFAVIGAVNKSTVRENKWWWNARVICEFMTNMYGPSFIGYATSCEGAKRIVEVLCRETDTDDAGGSQ
jgi:hypothetical protein